MYYSFIALQNKIFWLLVLIKLIYLVENNLQNPCLGQTGSVGSTNNLYICIYFLTFHFVLRYSRLTVLW